MYKFCMCFRFQNSLNDASKPKTIQRNHFWLLSGSHASTVKLYIADVVECKRINHGWIV